MTQYIKHSFGVYRQGVTNGSPIVLDGPTDISLNIDQQSILKISRVGDDLVIYLVDGQQVVLEGFFLSSTGFQENRLFTSINGEIQEVELGERYGVFTTAEYKPLDVYDGGLLFDGAGEQPLVFEAKTAAVGGAGNLGVIAGGVAGIGLLGALAGGGGSSSQENSNSDAPPVTTGRTDTDGTQSPAAADTVDAVAPTAPVIQIANASRISGTGEPGASVGVDANGDGVADLTTTVAGNGSWSVTPNPVLADGTLVTARQTDSGGNQSLTTADTVDAVAPTAPVIQIANASQISGTGEPGAIIDLDTNGDGVVDLTTTVAGNGTWSVTPNPALADGTPITVRQTDPDGNQSLATADTVDAVAPTAPVIQIANASQISGTGEPGAIIDLDTNGDGVVDLTTTVAGNGTWSVTPNPALADGTSITVRQTDPDGNQSLATADTVDAVAPTAPVIQIANASQISGTGEPGASVGVDVNGDSVADLTTTVAVNGTWSVTPNPALADGTLVTARQTDPDGNQSLAAADTVDAVAPTAPVIQIANASQISGTGEPGASVGVDVNGDSVADLTTTVAVNGTWSVTPNPALADGTLVTARQTDPDGNQSLATADTVDAVAPVAPYVDVSSDGTQIIGSAEPNAEVSVSYIGSANQIITLNPITVSGTGSWNTVPNPTLGANEDVYVQVEDADGNESAYTLVLQGTDDGIINFNSLSGDIAIGVAAFDIESIDLSDDTSNALIISETNLQSLSTGSDNLRVDGVTGNGVTASGASANGTTIINGETYNIYEFAGGGQLQIDQDVMVIV